MKTTNFINQEAIWNTMVRKNALSDLIKVKEEFDAIVESLELMGDKEFIDSYKKAKEQVKKREFADWDEI